MVDIHRRLFLIAAGIVVLPQVAPAQSASKVYRIGYANLRATAIEFDSVFVEAMRNLGYVPGRNLAVEYRWAGNNIALFEVQVAELVRMNVDVIVTSATPGVRIAKRATKTIPIVMLAAADPVGTGLVESLARPGGNVTGLSLQSNDVAAKRVQLLAEMLPAVKRLAVLGWRSADSARVSTQLRPTDRLIAETQAGGSQLGLEVLALVVGDPRELPETLARIKRPDVEALIVQTSPLVTDHLAEILAVLERERIPAIFESGSVAKSGGLLAYGPDVRDSYRRAAFYVDRILKGGKPAGIPVEQPTKFELVVNLKTAKALGLSIPQSILLRADLVIE